MLPARKLLRNDAWDEMRKVESDQQKGLPCPPPQKPSPKDARLVDLTAPGDFTVGEAPLKSLIATRQSRRKFTDESLTLEELSFLLWATQGVKRIFREGKVVLRNVPSGGARHALETYLIINRVEGVEPGLYRYLPVEHKLCLLRNDPELPEKISQACCGQKFVGDSAVVFAWTAIPYRMEWRYTIAAPKLIALDAGHVCQNLYLAAEAIEAGTCAIGAYYQDEVDEILAVDGENEMAFYLAPVGRI